MPHKRTGITLEKLKAIGADFGISESAVSHACRRATDRVRRDSKLRKKIKKMNKKLNQSRFKTPMGYAEPTEALIDALPKVYLPARFRSLSAFGLSL